MSRLKQLSLYSMSLFYILAGCYHFINPSFYEIVLPPFIPAHGLLVIIGGVFEIIFGLMLIPKSTRRAATYLIILMLIVYIPLHIWMLIDFIQHDRLLWAAILRLPLQFVLIWWAYSFIKSSSKQLYR